jgi:HlyD family secretion protein
VRVANGPAFKGSNLQEIFVLNKGKAERRTVKTGLSNFDYIEILTGIKPGDVVITSDMKAYENTAEVAVNN